MSGTAEDAGAKYGLKMYGGQVTNICAAYRQRFGIVDGKGWGTAPWDAQVTYRNFGCRKGV
jgi:hypothetical protein